MAVLFQCMTKFTTNKKKKKKVYMCTVSGGKESACKEVQCVGHEDPLEKGLAAHSSIHGWRIPWTEEPGRLQSMGW